MYQAVCLIVLVLFLIPVDAVQASETEVFERPPVEEPRVEPPHWWVGMNNTTLEIMIHDTRIGDAQVRIAHPGVFVKKVHRVPNPNYLFIELEISKAATPGTFPIRLDNNNDSKTYFYELKTRRNTPDRIQGLDNSDLIYLIMPDRFANGDPSNDSFEDLKEQGINRSEMYDRHGGDLQGIIDHLDYIEDLGATALWLNPVIENDMPKTSYHGYAMTDLYEVDKRFGGNAKYQELIEKLHRRDMKIVMDVILNHWGLEHWMVKDLPSPDFINQWDEYTKSTFRAPTVMDPYASNYDRNLFNDGWFDQTMPDLNQRNPRVARYMIQNNIWWIEQAGIDAYRIDTYAYPDQAFMSEWAKAILDEFPNFTMYGETWVHGPGVQAQFTEGNFLRGEYNSHLQSVTDFQLNYAFHDALTHKQGWTEGVSKIYFALAQDFLYKDPYRNVIFLDNHDKTRFLSAVDEDVNRLKCGLGMLMTLRGIPQVYYGTEILLKGEANPDGLVRQDFPGGWDGDAMDKFNAEGRTFEENDLFTYFQTLAIYRKENPVLQTGRLMQFVPENGIYVYFRYNEDKTVMVIVNCHEEAATVMTNRYKERMSNFTSGLDVINNRVLDQLEKVYMPGYSIKILELQP
ncbi:MAG: glycoside hydrolase family 13 protein [Bacteroidota bacterium]